MALRPGEIYYADFADMERHRVIVVSREELNRGNHVIAVLCTSKKLRERARLPNCVFFRKGEFGFTMDCVAQAETLSEIQIEDLDVSEGPIGTLDGFAMRNIIKAIGYVMDSECEPG